MAEKDTDDGGPPSGGEFILAKWKISSKVKGTVVINNIRYYLRQKFNF